MTEVISHRLSEKNFVKMTAVCSECGPVDMRSRGKGRMACGKKVAAKHARWAASNPQQARRNRKSRSAHKLVSFDPSTHTGVCPVCGPVGVVPKGRGYMCETRAKELWTIQQVAPQERCPECSKAYLSADGTCKYCTDRNHLDWAYALRKQARDSAELTEVHDRVEAALDFVIDPTRYDPSSVEGEYVSNPALKTLGEPVLKGRSHEAFIKSWWAQNGHLVENPDH